MDVVRVQIYISSMVVGVIDLDIVCPLNWVDEMEVMGDLYTNMELLNLN